MAAELNALRAGANPDAAPLVTVAKPMVKVDDNTEAARAAAGATVAWYLCSMGELHPRFISGQGYEDEVRAVQAANPRLTPISGVIPPEASSLLDDLVVAGEPVFVGEQLAGWDAALSYCHHRREAHGQTTREPSAPALLRPTGLGLADNGLTRPPNRAWGGYATAGSSERPSVSYARRSSDVADLGGPTYSREPSAFDPPHPDPLRPLKTVERLRVVDRGALPVALRLRVEPDCVGRGPDRNVSAYMA